MENEKISTPGRVVHLENLVDAQFICEILGVLLYSYCLYILLTSKKSIFRHAFYDLFRIGAVFDITLLVAIIFMRIRKRVGLCEEWEIVTRIANTITGTNFAVHVYVNGLIAINRFTAVHIPLKHDRIWQRNRYWPLCALLILFGFGSQAYLFALPYSFIPLGDTCAMIKTDQKFPRYLSLVSVAFFECDCLVLSPITIYAMHNFNQKFGQYPNGRRQEAGLAFFSLIKCVVFSFELVYELTNLYKWPITNNWFFTFINAQFWAYFYVIIFLNCPIIVLLSQTLRKDIIRRWTKSNAVTGSTITQTVVAVRPAQ